MWRCVWLIIFGMTGGLQVFSRFETWISTAVECLRHSSWTAVSVSSVPLLQSSPTFTFMVAGPVSLSLLFPFLSLSTQNAPHILPALQFAVCCLMLAQTHRRHAVQT